MIPYLLAAVGGYLIGQSQKKDVPQMAKGGEIYKIQRKYKYDLQPKWEDERFQTGGKYYLSFKEAQDVKKKLQGLSSSMEYKVVKVEEKMASGGVLELELIKDIDSFDKYYDEVGFTKKELSEPYQKDGKYFVKTKDVSIAESLYDEGFVKKYADGGMMAKGNKHYVGRFTEAQLKNKEDKKAVEKAKKETGLKYVDTKMVKKAGKIVAIDIYLIDEETYLKQPLFAEGGVLEHGLREDDKIYVEKGNLAGIKNMKTEEKFIVDISTGSREKVKD